LQVDNNITFAERVYRERRRLHAEVPVVVVHFKFRIKLFDEADNNIFWAGIQTFWYAAKLQGIFCMYTAQANQVNTTGFVFLILHCVFLVPLSTSFIFSSSSVSIVSISDVWFFRRFLKVFLFII